MARLHGALTRLKNRLPRARDRAWQSMRILRRFILPDLISTAEISHANITKYVGGLRRSGYIVVDKPQSSGKKGGYQIYRLVRNTGPKAPRLQSNGNTYDPNEEKVYEGGTKQ